MCGIAGIVGRSATEDRLLTMLSGIRHRGDPEHFAERFVGPGIALGTNRLAIVDPARGRQPFQTADGRVLCVYNGEIYNSSELRTALSSRYAFQTECDSEVVLAAYLEWGQQFAHHLRGMFGVAIVDWGSNEPLLMARDPHGIKPLYFAVHDNEIYFASELKAFQELTFLKRIEPLAAGGLFASGRSHKYYRVPEFSDSDAAPDAFYDDLARQLTETVRCHMPHRSESVACLLSGGIDSSTVLYLASRVHPRVKAFTFANAQGEADDLDASRHMCENLGIELQVVSPSVAPLREFYLSRGVFMAETWEPALVRNAVSYHFLCRAVAAGGHKWCLSGEGADEVFGGYDYFQLHAEGAQRGAAIRASVVEIHRTYLQMADRASMYASLEVRVPYMDKWFVAHSAKLPRAARIRGGVHKAALRELFPAIPAAIRRRPKMGMNAGAGFGSNDPGRSIYYAAVLEHYTRLPDALTADLATCEPTVCAAFGVNREDLEEIFNFAQFVRLGYARSGPFARPQLNTSALIAVSEPKTPEVDIS